MVRTTNTELLEERLTVRSEPDQAGQKEIFSSWALFIVIMLLITALMTSYILQQKRIQAVHETVVSIFAGQSWHFVQMIW